MKILREVYLRRESHLPAHGWLHACWTCESITGKTLEHNTTVKGKRIYKFIVYLCPKCTKKLKKPENQQKFSNSCDKFIEEYLDTCGP
jgi:hypothetical protein